MLKKIFTLANFLTIASIACGIIAYFRYGIIMSHASLATGISAFLVGLV